MVANDKFPVWLLWCIPISITKWGSLGSLYTRKMYFPWFWRLKNSKLRPWQIQFLVGTMSWFINGTFPQCLCIVEKAVITLGSCYYEYCISCFLHHCDRGSNGNSLMGLILSRGIRAVNPPWREQCDSWPTLSRMGGAYSWLVHVCMSQETESGPGKRARK